MALTEQQRLVERILRGDTDALGRLLEKQQGRLFNVVIRMVGNRDDAAEITQQAMLKIIEHVADFNGRASITTWMTRIAMNLSITHLRKMRLRRHASLDSSSRPGNGEDQASPLGSQLQDPREPGPLARVQQSEERQKLGEALDLLPDDLRAVIVLRDLQEMDYREISATLNIPMGTVKSRLFRARLALRQAMYKLSPPPATHLGRRAEPGRGEQGEQDDGPAPARGLARDDAMQGQGVRDGGSL